MRNLQWKKPEEIDKKISELLPAESDKPVPSTPVLGQQSGENESPKILEKMDETITIRKVRLVKDKTLTLSYEKEESDRTITLVENEKHKSEVHQDLKNAIKSLRVHFGLLSGYIKAKQVKKLEGVDLELLNDLFVLGYSIAGKEDEMGVVLTGQIKTPNGKFATLNTPFIRWDENDETGYRHIDALQTQIYAIETEVGEYLDGKVAPQAQTALDFKEDPNEEGLNSAENALPPSDRKTAEEKETVDA